MLARYKRDFNEDFVLMLVDVNEGVFIGCTQNKGNEYVYNCKSEEWQTLIQATMEE
jgi:hypothetical protein